MKQPLRRVTAFFLALVLSAAMIPYAFASQQDAAPTESAASPPETTIQTEPTETTEPTEVLPEEEMDSTDATEETTAPTEEATDPTEESTEPESSELEEMLHLEDNVMLAAGTIGNVQLFDQASPNYTTYLKSQLTVTYKPNGVDASKTAYIKNLGWHFARINGVSYPDDPIYCIEPHKNFAASTSGNFVDQDTTLSGSGSSHGADVWYSMPTSYRRAIGLVLLYSDQIWDDAYKVSSTPMASNPNVPLRIATQFLIYEIVMGLRDADTFQLKSSNGYTSGNIFYNAGKDNVSGFATNYNAIVGNVQKAMKVPSFTSRGSGSAPTISLTGEETVVTDSNGVVSLFTFQNGNGAKFRTSGNQFYIQQTGSISPSTVFKGTRYLPSADSSTFSIYYGGTSTYQTCIKLYQPSESELNAYFKLKPSTGSLALVKTTDDGQNLAGWQFSIYSDSACQNLMSGPHTTDGSGKLTVKDLAAGTFYVKEIGHRDSGVDSQYQCDGQNPQKVTISSGETASVIFRNKKIGGSVQIRKTTNTGTDLAGWKIGIYTDAGCTAPIQGSPFTTAADGTIQVSDIQPGTYYAKEEIGDDPYWEWDTAVKTVNVVANETATVTFHNVQKGKVKIQKALTADGPLSGWKFKITDESGKEISGSPFTTDQTGIILSGNLLPGTYTVEEMLPEDSLYICQSENPQTVTVTAGDTAEVSFTNALRPGKISIEKVDTNGEPLAGAKFLLEWSRDGEAWEPISFSDKEEAVFGGCSNPDLENGCLTTGDDGKLSWENLYPGAFYRLTELEAPDGYQLLPDTAYEGKLPPEGLELQLRVVNTPVFTLPQTGVNTLAWFRMASLFSGLVCLLLLLLSWKSKFFAKRKEFT